MSAGLLPLSKSCAYLLGFLSSFEMYPAGASFETLVTGVNRAFVGI